MSSAATRVGDPLIPQIANDFGTGVGAAAVVTTAFAFAYGVCQLVHGPFGDRFGKVRVVTLAAACSALGMASVAAANSLVTLGLFRFLGGITASAVIPLSMAYIGDVVPYEQRQATLARFLFGQILGTVFGQIAGGVLGEFLHWRAIFLVFGALYVVAAAVLAMEMRSGRVVDRRDAVELTPMAILRRYAGLLARRRVRIVLAVVFIEAVLFYGGFTFFGAYLHTRFGLDYARIGLMLAFFGVGGLVYVAFARRLIATLGERGFAVAGGIVLCLAFIAAPFAGSGPGFAAVATGCGLGFYMMHTTLQTNATQMAPEARGSAVSIFASCLFIGSAIGVAIGGAMIERVGYGALFTASGVGLLGLGFGFNLLLAAIRREAATSSSRAASADTPAR
ncbi:MAG: MFS transporter [Alphaproteobacteria bacterium]|nr:MFS transporter [Alphaproteobacteria bacterium]